MLIVALVLDVRRLFLVMCWRLLLLCGALVVVCCRSLFVVRWLLLFVCRLLFRFGRVLFVVNCSIRYCLWFVVCRVLCVSCC